MSPSKGIPNLGSIQACSAVSSFLIIACDQASGIIVLDVRS